MTISSFQDLKKNSANIWDNLKNKLEEENKEGFEPDNRYWKPSVDQAGNGFARIRFLPPCEGEDAAWVSYFDHFFQGPTGLWYIENDLSTLNLQDPCSEYNTKLWNKGTESGKDQARKQKRRLNYVANIYVVKDPGNRANEGKVFLYKFGKKIYEKIELAMNPHTSEFGDDDSEEGINPFDFWSGHEFVLRIKNKGQFRNYDDSSFDMKAKKIAKTDEDIELIWKAQHSLKEIVDPSNFKPYGELKARLNVVLGLGESYNDFIEPHDDSIPFVGTDKSVGDSDDIPFALDDGDKKEDSDLDYYAEMANG